LRMYTLALGLSDQHDDSTTRMCSLWLEHDQSNDVSASFAGPLQNVPSHKFIFLAPQLAAKLYKHREPTSFDQSLGSLITRLCKQHPFHILYQIITLASGVPPVRKPRASEPAPEGRGPAAAEMYHAISANEDRPLAAKAAKNMKLYADAAVQWCYYTEEGMKAGHEYRYPTNAPIVRCPGLPIPIATSPPAVDLTMQYSGIPTFGRYRSSYKVAGGIHRPKIMKCMDTNGKTHMQLVSFPSDSG
jgi:ataxia telangiectasia mutated family protein